MADEHSAHQGERCDPAEPRNLLTTGPQVLWNSGPRKLVGRQLIQLGETEFDQTRRTAEAPVGTAVDHIDRLFIVVMRNAIYIHSSERARPQDRSH
jgi:hypothetical protein